MNVAAQRQHINADVDQFGYRFKVHSMFFNAVASKCKLQDALVLQETVGTFHRDADGRNRSIVEFLVGCQSSPFERVDDGVVNIGIHITFVS